MKVKKHFDFDRDELHNHYCDKDRYPFEEIFKTQRCQLEVGQKMSKAAFIGYLKTFSGYNTYLEKMDNDPVKEVEENIDEDEVTCLFDYFVIECQK